MFLVLSVTISFDVTFEAMSLTMIKRLKILAILLYFISVENGELIVSCIGMFFGLFPLWRRSGKTFYSVARVQTEYLKQYPRKYIEKKWKRVRKKSMNFQLNYVKMFFVWRFFSRGCGRLWLDAFFAHIVSSTCQQTCPIF